MKILDLFSGIGGFSAGLEAAGMQTVAFCENNAFCRKILLKHWPEVPIYDDVKTLTAARLAVDGICVDLVCGGFPCQDISSAGKGAGIKGERSGLWSQFARIIGEVRPHYALVENVAMLKKRGLDIVLGDLATLGYDAEWHCIPASAVGAPHRRDRIWIVAYPRRFESNGCRQNVADADSQRQCKRGKRNSNATQSRQQASQRDDTGRFHSDVADPNGIIGSSWIGNADSQPQGRLAIAWGECGHWLVEPDVGRVAHGVPNRVDRLRALGNSLVPQIPELIGRAIMEDDRAAAI